MPVHVIMSSFRGAGEARYFDPIRDSFQRYRAAWSGQRGISRHADRVVTPDCPTRPTAQSQYARAGVEPPLEEVLQDPIVWLRARAAGLNMADVQRLLAAARRRLSATHHSSGG